eukprot:2844385-Alexandrium_andersonii.AAC.1
MPQPARTERASSHPAPECVPRAQCPEADMVVGCGAPSRGVAPRAIPVGDGPSPLAMEPCAL